MNAQLQRYVQYIDNAPLRQRVLIFAAAALMAIFVVNLALLDPLRARQRALGTEIAQRQDELQKLQDEFQRLVRAGDGERNALNRTRVAQLREQLGALNQRITEEERRFTSPERMGEVLQEMLARNKRLSLVELKSLSPAELGETAGQGSRRAYRHGIELTVAGSYLDIYSYLTALEKLPTQIYWGRAEMTAAAYPTVLFKLTVYTISIDKAWLVV